MAIAAPARNTFGSTGGTRRLPNQGLRCHRVELGIQKSPCARQLPVFITDVVNSYIKTHAGVAEEHYNRAMSTTAGENTASSLNAIGREVTVRPSAVNSKFLSGAAA